MEYGPRSSLRPPARGKTARCRLLGGLKGSKKRAKLSKWSGLDKPAGGGSKPQNDNNYSPSETTRQNWPWAGASSGLSPNLTGIDIWVGTLADAGVFGAITAAYLCIHRIHWPERGVCIGCYRPPKTGPPMTLPQKPEVVVPSPGRPKINNK